MCIKGWLEFPRSYTLYDGCYFFYVFSSHAHNVLLLFSKLKEQTILHNLAIQKKKDTGKETEIQNHVMFCKRISSFNFF